MDLRPVLRQTRDETGRVAFLFGAWGAVASATAIEQIEVGACTYFVRLHNGDVAMFEPFDSGEGPELQLVTTAGEPLRTVDQNVGRMGA